MTMYICIIKPLVVDPSRRQAIVVGPSGSSGGQVIGVVKGRLSVVALRIGSCTARFGREQPLVDIVYISHFPQPQPGERCGGAEFSDSVSSAETDVGAVL